MWMVWGAAAWAQAPVTELTLDEALDRLAADSPDLAAVQARARSARGVVRQAAAAFLPVVALNGTYTRNNDEVVLSFSQLLEEFPIPLDIEVPDDVVIQPLEVWNGAAAVTVPLLTPSAWQDWTAARNAARAAGATADEARLQLEAGLVTAAASVEAATAVVAAAERAAEVAEAHLANTRVAEAVGTATNVDVLAAQADVAAQRGGLVQAKAQLEKAEVALGGLLGVDGPARVTLPPAEPAPAEDLGRPAVTAADAQVAAAQAAVRSAWLRHLPTVSGTAAALAATVPYPTGEDTAWRLGLDATWVLYDGGFRYGRLDQARADLAAAEAFRTSERLRVGRELGDAERDVVVAREQVALAEEQSRLAAEAARIAGLGLAAGTTSALQARDVEGRAFQAEVGVAAARAKLRIAEAALRRARGQDQR